MKTLLKNIAYFFLPKTLLKWLKNIHYNRTFKTFSIMLIPEYEIMLRLIPIGSVVIDIGANIGLFSKFFSHVVGSEGKVYSLEPVPQTYEILCSNIKLLKVNNVVPLNYAASDSEVMATMMIPTYQSRHGVDVHGNVYEGKGDNFYEAKIIQEDERGLGMNHVSVETKKIDLLFADNAKNISFIKCDVEGHELECILGSLNIIRKNQPALLIEVMGNPEQNNSSAFRLFEILKFEGYIPFYLKDKFLVPFKNNSEEINFFFLQSYHLEKLNSLIED